jgi:hypothetical protein
MENPTIYDIGFLCWFFNVEALNLVWYVKHSWILIQMEVIMIYVWYIMVYFVIASFYLVIYVQNYKRTKDLGQRVYVICYMQI